MKKAITALVLLICVFALNGCAKAETIDYKDVIFDSVNLTPELPELMTIHEPYKKLHTSFQSFSQDALALGVGKDALALFDEEYFETSDMLFIGFGGSPHSSYSFDGLELKGDILTVKIKSKTPEFITLLLVFKGVYISLDKGILPDGISIRLDIKDQVISDNGNRVIKE